jgi:GLPGLI family protein
MDYKKIAYCAILILFNLTFAHAQQNEQCLGQIIYTCKLAKIGDKDSLRYSVYKNELLIGKNASVWNYIKEGNEKITFKGIDTAVAFKNKKVKEYIYNEIEKISPTSSSSLLKKYNSQILLRQQISEASKKYLILDTLPKIDWRIFEDKKTILSYVCQKAIGIFRGRTYIVWFTAELPMPAGPWKLNGLPGIILAANDDKNEVFFKAIKIVTDLNCLIPYKLDGEIITSNQYYVIMLKELEKYGNMLKASGNGEMRIGKVAEKELTKN